MENGSAKLTIWVCEFLIRVMYVRYDHVQQP